MSKINIRGQWAKISKGIMNQVIFSSLESWKIDIVTRNNHLYCKNVGYRK